jgi:hypothetical protein
MLAALVAIMAQTGDAEAGPAFVKRHCLACHSSEKQKGKVCLDDLTSDVTTGGTRWAMALDQVRRGAMPHPRLLVWPVVLSNLYLTLLHAAGRPRDRFGIQDNALRGIDQSGVIQELLA